MSPREVANMTIAQLRIHITSLKELQRRSATVNSFAEAKALYRAKKRGAKDGNETAC